MRIPRTLTLAFCLLALLLALAACRDDEETLPTAVPTAAVQETEESEGGAATRAPEAAAEPRPVRVNPEDINWTPQVLTSSPAPGEEAALDEAITVRFDQPMDQESVEAAFGVTQATGDSEEVPGTFSWPRPDTVVFTPQAELRRQQSYEVQIGETAAGQNGLSLETPVNLALQTVGFLEVSQVIPAEGSGEVQTDAAITVMFNRPVVPLVSSGQQAGLPQPLTIDPPVEGEGEWVSTSIYRFTPEQPLAGATTYQVTIESGLEDVTGNVLNEDVSWRFSTLNPSVVTVEPENGAEKVIPTTAITVTFNMPMDRASAEAAIAVRSDPPSDVSFDAEWLEDDRVVVLEPSPMLDLATTYQVVVGQSAQSASGQATLDRETVSGFATVPFPAVEETMPASGAVTDPFQRGVYIRFASPMEWSTVEDRILIEPQPERVRYFFNPFDFSLNLDFNLDRNTQYTITIPGDAADPYGNTLGNDYTWQFTSPGRSPIASFNLPADISQLSTAFPTAVEIIHVNVSRLDVALYDLGLPLNLINEPYTAREYSPAADPLRTWSLPLTTTDEQVAVTPLPLAEEGTLPTGVYLLNLTAPEVAEEVQFWQNQRHVLILADTNVVVKEMFGDVHVWVTELASGQPAQGRNVALYNRQGVEIGSAVSDASGFARFAYDPEQDFLEGVTVVSNAPGAAGFGVGSSNWNPNANPWNFGLLNSTTSDEAPVFAYIYTDRPIYRPGDTVYFKGIVRDPNYGRYAPLDQQTLDLRLIFSSFFGEQGLDETIEVSVNEDGNFDGEYSLPEDVTLGTYQLFLENQSFEGFRTFTVAEYRAPEFLVTMTPGEPELLRGQPAEVVLAAEYFFGGSAAGLEVNWAIYEDAYQPDVPGPFYHFGDGGDFFYEPGLPFGGPGGGVFGRQIANGSGQTDENGRLIISLPAELLQDADEGSRMVTVEANVSDLANFPVASRTEVVFHAAEVYVGVIPADPIAAAATEAEVDLKTVDWEGQTVANQNVEVVFYRREWVPNRNSDFGIYYTEWEAVDSEVDRTQTTTDGQGQAQVSFTPEEGGTYLAVATVTDGGGRTHTSSTSLWVTDSDFFGWRSDPRERRMELAPDQQEYAPGDTASILVQSPFAGPVQAWLTIERGTLIEQQVVTLESSSHVLEIPITADFAPNVFVSVTAIKGVDANDPDNPYADIRLGIVELVVSPQQLALNVALTPQGDQFEPGDTAVYDIRVTNYQGSPVQANLSLVLVDLAVLTLTEDNAPPILEAFYARQPYRSRMGSGLFISGEGLEPEIPLEGGGLGGGGGGDAAQEAVGRLAEDEEDVRRDFPDTAYWEANVDTDANGQATVEIPLPDSLTTWRLSSKAVTEDNLVGQGSTDVIVSLPLLVRPVTPRFLTVGDVVELGAIVNNNSGQSLEVAVSLEAEGVTLNGAAEQTITVPANGQQLVRWQATVDDVEAADLTFRASGGEYRDATKPTFGVGPDNVIPVYRYDAEDVVGTSGVLEEAGQRVEAILLPESVDTRRGEVDVQLSPSLAAALIDTLEVVNDLEYTPVCAHAVADHLLVNVATLTAVQQLELESFGSSSRSQLETLIDNHIQQVEELAKANGGWGWCYSDERDPWLTAYTLFALAKAQDAGYEVDAAVLDNAIDYLQGELEDAADLTNASEANRQAFFLYVLAELDQDVSSAADDLFTEHRALLDPYARALLTLAYEQAGDGGDNQQALLADLNDSVVLSATGAHWENADSEFRRLSSDVHGTATVVDALVRLEPDNALLPQAVRWLMAARTVNRWPTTQETALSTLALADWMVASGELEAGYDYALELNLQPAASGSFSQVNITESESLSLPVGSLVPDEVNFLSFERGDGDGRLYYTVHLDSFIDARQVAAVSRPITVQRVYYDAACDPETEECQPIDQIEAGQRVRVELTVIAPNDLLYAIVEDPIPAGAEAIDPGLETSVSDLGGRIERTDEEYRFGYWGWWYFERIEYRDEKVRFLAEFLPAGTYQYTYFLQTSIPGEYQVMPATAREEFFPEVFGRSEGMVFTIVD